MSKLFLTLTLPKRLLLFVFILIVSFFFSSIVGGVLMWKFGLTTPAVRIITIIQDVMFIVPPVMTALIITRQPATLLCIDRAPDTVMTLLAIGALIASIPAMNYIIYLNQNIWLPESLARWCTSLEQSAEGSVKAIFGDHTIPNLIMTILIVGIMAGLSEELLFRGGLQRLLVTGGVNVHAAIWLTAILFSAIHLQFYGFVPRMLLGAFFGYLLVWTRTLWIPIIMHVLNNTMYIISEWCNDDTSDSSALETIGSGTDYLWITLSAVVTAVLLYAIARHPADTKDVNDVKQ